MNYTAPTPSLCDNCTFAYFMGGGTVGVGLKVLQQRYCAVNPGTITESGYSSCPTNLPKDLPDSADRDIKCIAIQIHAKHPVMTAEAALDSVISSQELRAGPDMMPRFLAALVQVKEDVANIPLTRIP